MCDKDKDKLIVNYCLCTCWSIIYLFHKMTTKKRIYHFTQNKRLKILSIWSKKKKSLWACQPEINTYPPLAMFMHLCLSTLMNFLKNNHNLPKKEQQCRWLRVLLLLIKKLTKILLPALLVPSVRMIMNPQLPPIKIGASNLLLDLKKSTNLMKTVILPCSKV